MTDRLYNLLPAIYRIRDAAGTDHLTGDLYLPNQPLRALLGVMERELQALEANIDGLYDDWFIETAAEWVVPYLGDLLGVRGLHAGSPDTFSLRAYVANTLAYRRRKGTATMLEQLARDVTGWEARTVEFFDLLSTTQYLNHTRLYNFRTPDLRKADTLELLETPFDTAAHTADVRSISVGRGKYNIPNMGIFLWRLEAYEVPFSDARLIAPGFYTFNPLGYDQPLFNSPRTEGEITHLAEEINVPGRLRRRPLYAELEGWRQSLTRGDVFNPVYFDPDAAVLQVFVDNNPVSPYLGRPQDPVPAEQILICDLSTWRNSPPSKDYPRLDGTLQTRSITLAVDPVLGRLAFPSGVTPARVQVSYSYGFSGDVGGGPYNRTDSLTDALTGGLYPPGDLYPQAPIGWSSSATWQVGVSKNIPPVPGQIFVTLADAVQQWNSQPAGTVGVITVMDSSTYPENLVGSDTIVIPKGSQLLIIAADWPAFEDPTSGFYSPLPGVTLRRVGDLVPDGVRPHIQGNISVRGTASVNDPNPGGLVLDGLLIEGRLRVLAGNLGGLQVNHCTLVPDPTGGLYPPFPAKQVGLGVTTQNAQLAISLRRTICGPIMLPESVPSLSIAASIINKAGVSADKDHPLADKDHPLAIDAGGANLVIRESTVLGAVNVRSLEASNSIFTARVMVERRQAGAGANYPCVRYSFTTSNSKTPRRYRCQPDIALEQEAQALGKKSIADLTSAQRERVLSRVKPGFHSTYYGDPDYAQLSRGTDPGILTGAEDGAEMGVWFYLQQSQREANLRTCLEEYLRFGLEAGIFFVT